MTFSADTWARSAHIRRAIDDLPFVRGLADGTLDRERFVYYMAQDALYLADYGRVLAMLAGQATDPEDLLFWAEDAKTTLVVERELHGAHVEDFAAFTASPTCLAYTSYLQSLTTQGSYAVAVAGVLPCFWVYAHMGKVLVERAGQMSADHPYRTWVQTYDSPEFDESTRQAVQLLEQELDNAPAEVASKMRATFEQACVYELHFWASAHVLQDWDASVFVPQS